MKISVIGGESIWFVPLLRALRSTGFFSWMARRRGMRASIRVLGRLDRRSLADIGLERHRISESIEVHSRHKQ